MIPDEKIVRPDPAVGSRHLPMPPRGILLSIISPLVALAGTLLLQRIVPDRPLSFVLFFAAVAVSAGIGGFWAGVLSTLLSALISDFFFLEPFHSFSVTAGDLPLLILFVISALLVNAMSGRLQAQTRIADQRYYSLVQSLDGIVWEMNPRTMQFTFVNQRAERLLGYPVREWLSDQNLRARVTHPLDVGPLAEVWRRALSQGGEHTADYRVHSKDGAEFWIRETIFVSHDSRGQPNRITGLAIDITKRKAEEEELNRLKDEFAALNRICASLSSSLELDEFLHTLHAELKLNLNLGAGRLFLRTGLSEELTLVDFWGDQPESASEWDKRLSAEFSKIEMPSWGGKDVGISFPDGMSASIPELPPREDGGPRILVPLPAKEGYIGVLALFGSTSFEVGSGFYDGLGRQIGALLENVELYRQVREAQKRLSQLSHQLVTVQEAERRGIARELHDEVGQVLTGLKLTLEMNSRIPEDKRAEQLAKALELVQNLIQQVDSLSLDLRPPILDDLGLLPALHWHCTRYTAVTGVEVHVEQSGVAGRFPAEVEITAYRIVQEALTNIARHAGVSCATVRLWVTREMLGIQISDAGIGFDPDLSSGSGGTAGLPGMSERAKLLGGHLTVETGPGIGTSITVDIPLTPSA